MGLATDAAAGEEGRPSVALVEVLVRSMRPPTRPPPPVLAVVVVREERLPREEKGSSGWLVRGWGWEGKGGERESWRVRQACGSDTVCRSAIV